MNDKIIMKSTLNDLVIFEQDIAQLVKSNTPNSDRKSLNKVAVGLIGEFVVAAKLTEMGIKVTRLINKSPVDMLVSDENIPIEIKTARKGQSASRYHGKVNTTECYPVKLANSKSHITIIWLPERNEYYVIPTKELTVGVNRIYPNAKKWKHYRNNWSIITSSRIIINNNKETQSQSIVHVNRTEMAKKTGMDMSVVSRFLTGKRVPDAHQMKKMAEALGVSLDDLYRVLYGRPGNGS